RGRAPPSAGAGQRRPPRPERPGDEAGREGAFHHAEMIEPPRRPGQPHPRGREQQEHGGERQERGAEGTQPRVGERGEQGGEGEDRGGPPRELPREEREREKPVTSGAEEPPFAGQDRGGSRSDPEPACHLRG